MAETKKAACQHCDRTDVSVIANGTLRSHAADGRKVTADNPACSGTGVAPRSTGPAAPDATVFLCRVPAGPGGCGHQVQLTSNRRARTHLTPDGQPCPEGSSAFPVAVDSDGGRVDTAFWTEEQWAALDRENAAQESAKGNKCAETGVGCQGEVSFHRTPTHRQGAYLCTVHAAPAADRLDQFERDMYQSLDQELKRDVFTLADPHRREADIAIAEAERIRREEDAAYETALQDGMAESRRRSDLPHDRGAASFGLGPDGGLTPCEHDWAGADAWDEQQGQETIVTACTKCGFVMPDERDPDELFAVVHRLTDETGVEWIHPGEAGDCSLLDCCKHPGGFTYGDDDNGHSGSFCLTCGAEEPDLPEPEWGTPADLLAQMPADLVAQYANRPPCWDCGDRLALAANTFAPDGKPRDVVWICDRNCEHVGGSGHYGRACRPQMPWENRLGYLEPGDYFRRHRARGLMSTLIYKVLKVEWGDTDVMTAAVVSPGVHHGREGVFIEMNEEITCVDHNGQRLRRRGLRQDPGGSALEAVLGNLSGRRDGSNPRPTPSPSARTPEPSRTSSPTGTPAASDPGSRQGTRASAPGAGASSKKATASEPTEKAGTSARTAGTTVPDAFSTAKQATSESDRYDRFGRYKLVHPHTGKAVKWTRATTYAKSIADTYNLSMWSQRMTLKGAAMSPDIVAAVATLDVKQDRDRMNALVEDAKKAAGVKVAANLGTALHAFTEDRDKVLVGEPVKPQTIPEKLLPSVDAYEALLREFGLVPVPGLIEFTTAVLQYEIAGTSDRCYKVTRDITFKLHGRTVTLYAGEYVIGDVKSGADLSYGWMEICIQLAIYAQGFNSCGVWDWNTGTWGHPASAADPDVQVKVRTDVGLIPHLPVDRKPEDPLATLFAVDLDWGWATAVLCGQVRTARKEGNLATALTVADVAEGGLPEAPARNVVTRPATLEEKARAVTTQAAASAVWKEAVAARTPKAEVDRLVAVMREALEKLVETGG